MKTAILYSGHMRSFDKCLPNHAWMVHRHFPNADIYCATVFDADSHKVSLLESLGAKTLVCDKQPDFPLPPGCPEQWTPGQCYMHEPFFISVSPAAVLGQLWQLENVWRLVKEPEQYDCFVRIRPDIWFHESTRNFPIFPVVALTPWWGRFGGINDRFAIFGRLAAERYFTTFSRVNELVSSGCPLHPESLLDASLSEMSAGGFPMFNNLKNLNALFSTLRTSGEMRPPEISASDIAFARGGG